MTGAFFCILLIAEFLNRHATSGLNMGNCETTE